MRGRTNRTPEKRARVLEAIRSGMNHASAARAAGMSRRSLFEWKAADPEFAREVDDVYEVATDLLADHAMKRALSSDGHNHDALLIFLLRMRDPERFNRKMVDAKIVGDPNHPVVAVHPDQVQPGVRLVILPRDSDRDQLEAAA
jgi:hypothetical protein